MASNFTGVVALSGRDTISISSVIGNQTLTGLADGNVAELTLPNDLSSVKIGKNGNALYALNETGKMCELKIRVVRGSNDDKFLNSSLTAQLNNFSAFPLMIATLTKNIGDGTGNIVSDTYQLSGGIFQKQVEVKSNVEGESEQAVAVYMMRFSNVGPRTIG